MVTTRKGNSNKGEKADRKAPPPSSKDNMSPPTQPSGTANLATGDLFASTQPPWDETHATTVSSHAARMPTSASMQMNASDGHKDTIEISRSRFAELLEFEKHFRATKNATGYSEPTQQQAQKKASWPPLHDGARSQQSGSRHESRSGGGSGKSSNTSDPYASLVQELGMSNTREIVLQGKVYHRIDQVWTSLPQNLYHDDAGRKAVEELRRPKTIKKYKPIVDEAMKDETELRNTADKNQFLAWKHYFTQDIFGENKETTTQKAHLLPNSTGCAPLWCRVAGLALGLSDDTDIVVLKKAACGSRKKDDAAAAAAAAAAGRESSEVEASAPSTASVEGDSANLKIEALQPTTLKTDTGVSQTHPGPSQTELTDHGNNNSNANSIEPGSEQKIAGSSLRGSIYNRIFMRSQGPCLDSSPLVLIIPIYTTEEIRDWTPDIGYKAIVVVHKTQTATAIGMMDVASPVEATQDDIKKCTKSLATCVTALAFLLSKEQRNFTEKTPGDGEGSTLKPKEKNQIKQTMEHLDKTKTIEIPVLNNEGVNIGKEFIVMKVSFVGTNGATDEVFSGHFAPDPLLLLAKAAVVWSFRQQQRLLPGCGPNDEDESIDGSYDSYYGKEFVPPDLVCIPTSRSNAGNLTDDEELSYD